MALLDQADFPGSVPALDPLLPGDDVMDVGELLEPDQNVHAMLSRESRNGFFLMLSTRRARSLVTPTYSVPLRLLASK